jgi:hypothetical protein
MYPPHLVSKTHSILSTLTLPTYGRAPPSPAATGGRCCVTQKPPLAAAGEGPQSPILTDQAMPVFMRLKRRQSASERASAIEPDTRKAILFMSSNDFNISAGY